MYTKENKKKTKEETTRQIGHWYELWQQNKMKLQKQQKVVATTKQVLFIKTATLNPNELAKGVNELMLMLLLLLSLQHGIITNI